jgi:hypothetical protein
MDLSGALAWASLVAGWNEPAVKPVFLYPDAR